jgi:WD40 repeat protein
MGDSKYTNLSLPLCSESGPKSSSYKSKASKLVAGISGLVIFGYFMSSAHLSSRDASTINLTSSEARLAELVNQYQLKLVSTPDIVDEFGHPSSYKPSIVFSKDNSLAAFVSSQDSIEVWDLHKKELIAQFKQDVLPGMLVFTPDGKYVISSYRESSAISIWSLATKSLYGEIGDGDTPSSLFVSSDSKSIGFKTYEGVSVWDIGNLKKSYSLKVRDDSQLNNIAITPDGKYLAMTISGAVNIIRVYDMSTRKKIATINETQSYDIRISDDGKIVATADYMGKTVTAWNVETGILISKIEHEDYIKHLELSPDGRFVSSADYSKLILYDLKANKIFKEISNSSLRSVFTKDSKFLLVPSGYDILVIDLETSNEVAILENTERIEELCLSENSEYLLVSTWESVYLWDLTNLYN